MIYGCCHFNTKANGDGEVVVENKTIPLEVIEKCINTIMGILGDQLTPLVVDLIAPQAKGFSVSSIKISSDVVVRHILYYPMKLLKIQMH